MQPEFKIADRKIGGQNEVFLIAEAGVNHNGQLELAKQMIDVAADAGANAVKFQTFNVPDLILQNVEKAPYQKVTTDAEENQFEMLQKLRIDKDFHLELIEHCQKKSIFFLSTPYDENSLELLIKLKVSALKIASTDTTNLLFLEKVAASGKPVILSTGMSLLYEIEQAYRCLRQNGCHDLALLKCTSSYPTQIDEVNLRAMQSMFSIFRDAVIGFSDHTEGVGASPYAVAMGAKIVEKHFTLDKSMPGPDHRASLAPQELSAWVDEIRKVERMLGRTELLPTVTEAAVKKSLQKCIVSKVAIEEGETLTRENLTAKRTGGTGIPASMFYHVLGKKTVRRVDKDQVLYWQLIEE